MTDTMTIAADEHGVVRIFTIDLPEAEAMALVTDDDPAEDDRPMAALLGLSDLVGEYVDVVQIADLDALGLSGYLRDGIGLAENDIAPFAPQLDALKGVAIIVLSKAFGGQSCSVTPIHPLRWIATLSEPEVIPPMIPLRAESADGLIAGGRAKPSDAAMSGRIATLVLILLALLVVAMIWIGG